MGLEKGQLKWGVEYSRRLYRSISKRCIKVEHINCIISNKQFDKQG